MTFQSTFQQLPTPQQTPFLDGIDADTSVSFPNHSTSWTPVDGMTPISTNPSRKRSRDDSSAEAADGSYFPSLLDQVNTPAAIPEEPIYGEGMTVLNPQTGQQISAESQTGTWYEEKAEDAPSPQEQAPEFRPHIPTSRKSVRLSKESFPTVSSANNPFNSVLAASAPASPPKSVNHPEVDEATVALGIGWTKFPSEDVDIQAAARGWARYIENHYARHIHEAEILLKSSGLNAYLVHCQEGYYLFSEDLLEGKLVGRTWETTLNNLRAGPTEFEGVDILRAERTPGPEERNQSAVNRNINGDYDEGNVQMVNWADYNRSNNDGSAMVDGGMEVD